MAEFQEVMKQLNRYCTTNDGMPCGNCDLMAECPFNNSALSMTDETIEKLEKKIEKWAEEHPEPVYPTWLAWLANNGVVPIELPPDVAIVVTEIGLLKQIPACIAEKYGIQPKEDK